MKTLSAAIAAAALTAAGCSQDRESNRWATTENTNVQIDWNKVNEAYKQANGPEDLEKRINEIYEGDEIISIAVTDQDAKTQVVTGFFDKDKSGTAEEAEKVFTIQRQVTGEGEASMQTTGYGPYYGYHSPMMSIVSGMLIGSMISNAFSPRYVPVAYTTSSGRIGELGSQRAGYRAANPSRFQGKASRTGKSYGNPSGRSSGPARSRSGGGFRGGGRFGLRRRRNGALPVRLTA